MIFKTITDETTLSGQRIVGALQARKIAQQQATAQLEIDISCLKEYQVACQNGTVTTEQFDAIMHKASASAVEYSAKIKAGTGTAQSYANAQRATNSALQEVSIGAGIASKAVKLFSVALNMIAFTAIIQGISWLIGKVDEWIVTAKEAKESADAFKESLSTFFNETQTNLKTISSLSDRFDELSKNVDDTGKKIGGTEEEYAEFLDICQQVGQIMPELITGYTNEGEAIITLQGKVDSLTDSYKEAIKAKAALFVSKGDEEGNTIGSFFEDYDNFVNGYKGIWDLKISPSGQNSLEDFEEYYGYDKIHEWLSKVKDASLNELNNLEGELATAQRGYMYIAKILDDSDFDITNITEENYNAIHDVLNSRYTVLEKELSDRVLNIRSAFQNMLYADSDYWNIDDENVLSAINSLYGSIDAEFIKNNELFSQKALQTFESDFVSLFNNDTTKQAMVDFYTPIADAETVRDYTDRIKSSLETVQLYCNENGITVPINFDDSEQTISDLEAQYQRAVDFTKDKFDGYDPTAFFKEHSINTQEEIDAWQEIAQGARDAAEAEREYIQGSTLNKNPISLSITDTVEQLNTQLKPAFDSLQSAWKDIFTDDGFELNSIDILSTCDSIKSKLDEMSDPEGLNLDVDYSAFEDFVNVLNNTESTEQNVQDAFDSLATSITQAALSGAEDFDTMRAALEDLGVINNELVAFDAMISNTEALKEAGLDLADASDEQIAAFANESVAAENVTQAIAMLTFHKELCNAQEMNTAGEVANLKTLAENAGYTGEVIQYLTELEQIYQEVASGTINPAMILAKTARAAMLKSYIDSAANNINYEPKVDFTKATDSAKKAGSKSGKKAADKYLEAFEKELEKLQGMRDRNEITEKEYLDRLRVA